MSEQFIYRIRRGQRVTSPHGIAHLTFHEDPENPDYYEVAADRPLVIHEPSEDDA